MSQGGPLSSSGSGIPTPSSVNKGDILYAPSNNVISGLPISSYYGAPVGTLDTGLPGYLTPNKYVYLIDDFISGGQRADNFSTIGWSYSGSNGVGLQQSNLNFSGHPGYSYFIVNGAFSWTNLYLNPNGYGASLGLGYGLLVANFWIKLSQLSDGSNRFFLRFGLGDSQNDSEDSNSVVFRYQDNTNSGNWQLIANSSSVATTTNTSSAADTNWHQYTILINSAASLATFYIDNVSVGTVASNIPTSTAISPKVQFQNTGTYSSGTQSMAFDLFTLYMDLTTAR